MKSKYPISLYVLYFASTLFSEIRQEMFLGGGLLSQLDNDSQNTRTKSTAKHKTYTVRVPRFSASTHSLTHSHTHTHTHTYTYTQPNSDAVVGAADETGFFVTDRSAKSFETDKQRQVPFTVTGTFENRMFLKTL